MTLKEVMDKFVGLNITETRTITDNYCEVVFCTKDTAQWEKILAETLGPAIKPPKTKPGKDELRMAEYYGGIRNGQTLFRKDFDDISIIALLWPWQDNTCTTLKLAIPGK